MQKPTLVVMAAGMGSRFGGLKQMTPVDQQGHFIMDYSIFDAFRAGFGKIVCVIKEELQEVFEEKIGSRVRPFGALTYAYQRLDMLPRGFSIPAGRTKPWGTAHAVLCAAPALDGPFAVINADDFYGREAFSVMADFLTTPQPPTGHAMVAYPLLETLTDNGAVTRGQCQVDPQGFLSSITERLQVIRTPDGAAYTENGEACIPLPADTVVSMNFWGFQPGVLEEIRLQFARFLRDRVPENPLTAEFYLPLVSQQLLQEQAGTIQVLRSNAKWYGVTYREDLPSVVSALSRLRAAGQYPEQLWQP